MDYRTKSAVSNFHARNFTSCILEQLVVKFLWDLHPESSYTIVVFASLVLHFRGLAARKLL